MAITNLGIKIAEFTERVDKRLREIGWEIYNLTEILDFDSKEIMDKVETFMMLRDLTYALQSYYNDWTEASVERYIDFWTGKLNLQKDAHTIDMKNRYKIVKPVYKENVITLTVPEGSGVVRVINGRIELVQTIDNIDLN